MKAGVVALVVAVWSARAASAAAGGPEGESALDAWSALAEAEAREYRLVDDGVRTLSFRATSPFVDKLTERSGPYEGRRLRFTLWWRAPASSRVVVDADGAPLSSDERDRLAALFEPLPQLILPVPASRRLAGHVFRFAPAEGGLAPGETAVEATAVDPDDDRLHAVFVIGQDGLVRREHTMTRRGEVSEFEYERRAVAGRKVLSRCDGRYRGRRVSVELEWGAVVAGRPVPTRVTARQYDEAGAQLPGAEGAMTYVLSEHRLNVEVPDLLLRP